MSATEDNLAAATTGSNREALRGVILMSIPMVITTCSRMVMDLADFTMVSRMGRDAAAAEGALLPAQITLWAFIVLGFGTVVMVNTFVAQSFGRKKFENASAYAWQGLYLAIAYGLATLLLYPYLGDVFAWIGHSPDIQRLEVIYSRVALLTVAPTIAGEALACFFNGIHRPRTTMWSAVEANAINIACSAVLIFGWFGAPALGIAGAAWGTFIGVTYRLVRLLWSFLREDIHTTYGSRRTWRPDWRKIRAIIRVGVPQGLQWTSDVAVWAVFINILIGRRFGDTSLIASNVAWQYMRISFMPAIGVGIALSALVGKAIGERDSELAVRLTRVTAYVMITYMCALSTFYLIWRHSLIAWFNDSPEIVALGGSVMICAVIFQIFDGLGIVYNAALRGAGDTFWPAMLFAVSHWTICIGGGSLVAMLRPQWGIMGPWFAATFLLIFLGFALWWRWNSRAWQKIDIFKHEGAPAPVAVPLPPGEVIADEEAPTTA